VRFFRVLVVRESRHPFLFLSVVLCAFNFPFLTETLRSILRTTDFLGCFSRQGLCSIVTCKHPHTHFQNRFLTRALFPVLFGPSSLCPDHPLLDLLRGVGFFAFFFSIHVLYSISVSVEFNAVSLFSFYNSSSWGFGLAGVLFGVGGGGRVRSPFLGSFSAVICFFLVIGRFRYVSSGLALDFPRCSGGEYPLPSPIRCGLFLTIPVFYYSEICRKSRQICTLTFPLGPLNCPK